MSKDVFHEHLWIQLLLVDSPASSSLFFSGSKKQSQTRHQPCVSAFGQVLKSTDLVEYDFSLCHFGAVQSHHPKLMMFPSSFFFFFVCIYLLNTRTTVQGQQCSRLKLPLVYLVVMMVTNGSSPLAEDVILMIKHPLASVVCLLVLLCLHLPLLPQRGVFISSVTCCCKSNNEIQEPFVPIRFPNPTKRSLETGLIT